MHEKDELLGIQKVRPPTGGHKAAEFGICPVTTLQTLDGVHGGENAGRACWAIAGSLCGGRIQGTFAQKLQNCWRCEVMNLVKKEENPKRSAFPIPVSAWRSLSKKCRNQGGTPERTGTRDASRHEDQQHRI
ncbi:MAG TPA: hypothetical protein VL122_05030 [Nitrospirota bacterium]|nr:hypothetical protein [Nitrospirota bacterium]